MTATARHYAAYLRVNAGGRMETTMIRPEEVPDRVDADRERKIAEVESVIDAKLSLGLAGERAVVQLPEGCESVLGDVMVRYRGVGWTVEQEGMGFLTFRRGPRCKGAWGIGNNCKTCWHCIATDPHRPR